MGWAGETVKRIHEGKRNKWLTPYGAYRGHCLRTLFFKDSPLRQPDHASNAPSLKTFQLMQVDKVCVRTGSSLRQSATLQQP